MKSEEQPLWNDDNPQTLNQLLSAPFGLADLEWRVQQSGVSNDRPWALILVYVTNRAIMNRLDAVVGPDRWKNEYTFVDGGVLCGLSIEMNTEFGRLWITKWDGADRPETEAFKGVLSNSMKRAAVQWGIGRYLYDIETTFAETSTAKSTKTPNPLSVKGKKVGYWGVPANPMPMSALPEASQQTIQEVDDRHPPAGGAPKGGKTQEGRAKLTSAIERMIEDADNSLTNEEREWGQKVLDKGATASLQGLTDAVNKLQTAANRKRATEDVKPAARPKTPPKTSKATKVPDCEKCGGPMWDNTLTKRGKQPDYKCKQKGDDPDCEGAIWLKGAHGAKNAFEEPDGVAERMDEEMEDDGLPF